MTEPQLDAGWELEIIALMIEGKVAPPCKYVTHIPHVWFGDSGRAICGICHPPTDHVRAEKEERP